MHPMFPFPAEPKTSQTDAVPASGGAQPEAHHLDRLTGGAFSALTSSERTGRIRDWLARDPRPEDMQAVFKELSAKDKGAAKLLREKLDEIKRSRAQESIAQEWADRGEAWLASPKLNIADAMAWQRDAAKAGAPLSREPLLTLKSQLSERVKGIEDLQHRVQVQREAAVLLAQRIEVLSTKSWRDAQAAAQALQIDVDHWQVQAGALLTDGNWPSVEARFPPLLETSRGQLLVVWESFQEALSQTVAAAADAAAALPAVPVWADELRALRGAAAEPLSKPQKPKIDPEIRAQAVHRVQEALTKLEQEIAQGHGKASAGAAAALRQALKEQGRLIDDKLENQSHGALAAAGELEGWQRWRADQLREELVGRAEGLLKRPEGQALGGRKMQELLRALREQWKQTDQGGAPNQGLWKRFDEACNEAHKVVEAWLERVRAESIEHRLQRLAMIEDIMQWANANTTALDEDWRGFARLLNQFVDQWRAAGHVGDKVLAELQPLWQAAMDKASAPLEAVQQQSLLLRQAMVDEATLLGAAPQLRLDAVRDLQQRWQAQAQRVPVERRLEQKLWDAFRKPIDDAFNRKTQERERSEAALGERDRLVLDAARSLELANASADAQAIRVAMASLDAALRGQAQAQAQIQIQIQIQAPETEAPPVLPVLPTDESAPAPAEPSAAAVLPKPAPKPVVAVRGDDRPGMKKAEPAAAPRGGKFGERKDGGRFAGESPRGARAPDRGAAPPAPNGGQEAARLGDAAFRAQRDALERAQLALRKLAAQAHGEALTQLLAAWERRAATELPSAQELGSRVSPPTRATWVRALEQTPAADPGVALLRLEMAAEIPTPAEHIQERRLLQLQLLTRRHDPEPAQTWGEDLARLLACNFDGHSARRAQACLKVLLKA